MKLKLISLVRGPGFRPLPLQESLLPSNLSLPVLLIIWPGPLDLSMVFLCSVFSGRHQSNTQFMIMVASQIGGQTVDNRCWDI
jgi:hypothetical protein